MAGGKQAWVEVETNCPNYTKDNPTKGGSKSSTAENISGKESLLVGKVNKRIAKERGTF